MNKTSVKIELYKKSTGKYQGSYEFESYYMPHDMNEIYIEATKKTPLVHYKSQLLKTYDILVIAKKGDMLNKRLYK